jgi:hypothetical protein
LGPQSLITVDAPPGGALARAEAALKAIHPMVRAGVTSGDLISAAALLLRPYKFHPFVQPSIGNGIGLSFEDGGVYTLRCGAIGEARKNGGIPQIFCLSTVWSSSPSAWKVSFLLIEITY